MYYSTALARTADFTAKSIFSCRARAELFAFCARSASHGTKYDEQLLFCFAIEETRQQFNVISRHAFAHRPNARSISHWHRVSRDLFFGNNFSRFRPLFGAFAWFRRRSQNKKHEKDTKCWYNWRRRPLALGTQRAHTKCGNGRLAVATANGDGDGISCLHRTQETAKSMLSSRRMNYIDSLTPLCAPAYRR